MKPGMSLKNSKLATAAGFASIAFFAPSAFAQFNNAWLTLTQDLNRLKQPGGANADILGNGDEKDFAVADVDKDGWLDVAVGKKVQVSFVGPREGRFFHNEKGILVDRTTQYATASTIADQGFKTPLDTRDVEFVDVNGDGWLDMVTCQTDLGANTGSAFKNTTHPRVYINLQNDVNGNWQGFRFEDTRIPQLLTIPGGVNGDVRFCDLTYGDIDGDGDKDLYFVDYDTDENNHTEPAGTDLNDRLLINNGSGFFTDGTAAHFNNAGMWASRFGTECEMVDMNGDGKLDIVKITTLTDSPNRAECEYNDISAVALPNGQGSFDVKATIDAQTQQNYSMVNADINNDGKLDHLVGDDSTDHYRFNTGNSAAGTVNWSAPLNFSWLTGSGDDGFSGQMTSGDFNLDGWLDVVICDVDIDLAGCNRRTKIYHNMGGTPGATNIVLREEKQQSGSGGWFGAVGWTSANTKGVNDAAAFDIDNDGDKDIALGRCNGMEIWMNQTNPVVCQPQIAPASNGDLNLTMCGQPLWSNLTSTLAITNGPAFGSAATLVSLAPTTAPAFGGTILFPIIPSLTIVLPLDGAGAISLPIPGGGSTAAGTTVYVQTVAGYPLEVSNIIAVTLFN